MTNSSEPKVIDYISTSNEIDNSTSIITDTININSTIIKGDYIEKQIVSPTFKNIESQNLFLRIDEFEIYGIRIYICKNLIF